MTPDRLRELLRYDPETGVFTWLRAHQRVRIGDVAGAFDGKGYVRIRVDGRKYRAHRLAWLYVHGRWPKQLDHRDMDKANNRLRNLREASEREQRGNRYAQRNNTSGHKGVSWFKPKRCWRVTVARHHVGYFRDKEAAAVAYVEAAQACFGEFARVG